MMLTDTLEVDPSIPVIDLTRRPRSQKDVLDESQKVATGLLASSFDISVRLSGERVKEPEGKGGALGVQVSGCHLDSSPNGHTDETNQKSVGQTGQESGCLKRSQSLRPAGHQQGRGRGSFHQGPEHSLNTRRL